MGTMWITAGLVENAAAHSLRKGGRSQGVDATPAEDCSKCGLFKKIDPDSFSLQKRAKNQVFCCEALKGPKPPVQEGLLTRQVVLHRPVEPARLIKTWDL